MPLWNLTRNLRHLSISPWYTEYLSEDAVVEQTEDYYLSYELSAKRPGGREAREALHSSVALRTFITAAKTGRLRRLSCELGTRPLAPIFAVRSLLQHWVGVEEWDIRKSGWNGAAASLRAALAHASLAKDDGDEISGRREDRLLSAHHVAALQSALELDVPRFIPQHGAEQPIRLYLPWLANDELLAQQVANAWNAVVLRDEADRVKCPCLRCKDKLASLWA